MPTYIVAVFNKEGTQMGIFAKLFSDTVGLISLFTIAFVIVIAIYLFLWVRKQAEKDAAAND